MRHSNNRLSIPSEVRTFLSSDAGRSLLVEGEAGTGKTTFALQLLEELGAPDRSFYLSTRVSDDSLYSMFPWLREKDMQSRVIDAGKLLLESLVKREKEEEPKKTVKEDSERITRARQFLRQIGEQKEAPTKVDRSRLGVMLEHFKMPEVERVYDRIENCLPERSMLVIDSVEGVTHKYGLDMEEFVTTLQKDLVEGSGCNVVFVLEKVEASHIEYVVDGVLSLERGELDRRRVRHSHLHKLRATEIKQPHYLLTLRGGRFSSFAPYTPSYTGAKKWEPRNDPEGFYSTGIPDFDSLLGGGFKRGSYHVFEVSEDVTNEDYFAIIRPILLNFIAQGRALFALLSGGDHPETLRNDLIRFIDPETFDSKVRIPDYFLQESKEKYVMALGGKTAQENLKLWMEAMQVLRGPKNRPIIEFTGFDTLEYIRGGDVAVKMLLNAVAKMKISEDLGIGILKPGLKVTQEIINMADTYFKVVSIDKCPCIYGVKPKTIIHAIVGDDEKGAPNVKLLPIV